MLSARYAFRVSFLMIASMAYADFDLRNFRSHQNLVFFGQATPQDKRVRLTKSEPEKSGSIWYKNKISITKGFRVTFHFQLTNPGPYPKCPRGGEGIYFLIQNNQMKNLHGRNNDLPNSLFLEFDCNRWAHANDPNDNHIAVQSMGTSPNTMDNAQAIALTTRIPIMSDGMVHFAKIEYIPGQLRVYLDKTDVPVLIAPVRLDEMLFLDQGTAWVGLSAFTGAAFMTQDILTWSFESFDHSTTTTSRPTKNPSEMAFSKENSVQASKEVTDLITRLQKHLSRSFMDPRFAVNYRSQKNAQKELDDLIENATRSKSLITRIITCINNKPELHGMVGQEGVLSKEWNEEDTTALIQWYRAQNQQLKAEAKKEIVINHRVRIELYYRPNEQRLSETAFLLDGMIRQYKKMKKDLP